MKSENEHINRIKAAIISVIFHIILVALLFFITIVTPIPPFPDAGGSGLEINYGTSDDGMGDVQPDETNIKLQTAHHANINNNDDILTQDKEDAPVLDVKKNNKQKKSVENQEIKKQTVEETPKVDVNALYTKKKANGNEGETGKAGDQGKVYGDKNVKTHGNGGSGGGNGSGNGTGNGNGNGSGSGNGSEFGKRVKSPVSYSLKGRKSLALPKPPNNFKEGGIVVVEITVDRKGNVIKAIPGYRGTTSTNETLINMAKQAALNAKFDPNPDAAEEQKGTITYNFIIGN